MARPVTAPAPRESGGAALAAVIVAASLAPMLLWFGAANATQAVDAVTALSAAGASVACIVALLTGSGPAITRRVVLPGALFLGWALMSALASGRGWSAFAGQPTSMLGWSTLAALAALALVAASAAPRLRPWFAGWAWAFVAAQSLLAIGQLFRGAPAAGTLPNSTYLGEMLLLLLPWTLAENDRPWLRRISAALAVVALSAGGSRVASAVALVWAVWWILRRSGLPARARHATAASAAVLAAAAGLLFARAELLGTVRVATLGLRPVMLRLAAEAVALRPILGWGPDGFVAGGGAASTLERARSSTLIVLQPGSVDPHSSLAWIAVSTGVVGFALFTWLAVAVVRNWRAQAVSGEDVAPAAWAVAGSFVVMLTAPAALQTLPLFAVVLGLSLASGTREPDRRSNGGPGAARHWWTSALVVLALITALAAANGATRARLELASAERSPSLAPAAEKAARLWAVDPHLWHLASLHWGYVGLADPRIAASRPDLTAAEKAVALDARDPFYALELARTRRYYELPPAQVEAAFTEAFMRYPAFPLGRAEYALFLAQQGRDDDARRELELARLGDRTGDGERMSVISRVEELLGR